MLKKKKLSDYYVDKLDKIFREKNWKYTEPGKYSVFDRFCERMETLENDEQRDLMIELTHNFLWISFDKYEEYLLEVMNKLFCSDEWNERDKSKAIFICPLLSPNDFTKVKSGIVMGYLCQMISLRTYPEFQNDQIRVCKNPEILKEYIEKIGALVLLDDFIGSGETAIECLAYLDFLRSNNIKIYVVALVAQKKGVENIKKFFNVPVFESILRERGISDSYPEQEVKKKLEIMKSISKSIKVNKKMYLGYAETESLVAMIKTPNNTFPVYWYENEKSKAPFVRKANIKEISGD